MKTIEPKTRARLFDAICADPEIVSLIARGSSFEPIDREPVYEPDKCYVSREIDEARAKAKSLVRSLAPEVDTSTIEFGTLFLEARFKLTERLRK